MKIVDYLRSIPEFTDVPEDQLTWLGHRGEVQEYGPGVQIFAPGDAVDSLWILSRGGFTIRFVKKGQFHAQTQEEETRKAAALFVFIGAKPVTD